MNMFLPSDCYSSRRGNEIKGIVLHYPAPGDGDDPYSATAVWKMLARKKLSYHYYIDKAGKIYQFVPDVKKAWHAGSSVLHGMSDCNYYTLGVCMANNGGEEYGEEVLIGTGVTCKVTADAYRIPTNMIAGHCHVSPGRKVDPGPHFPWYYFFENYFKS